MKKRSTVFYASLVAGVLSLLDLRPAASTGLRLLAGVEVLSQDTVNTNKKSSLNVTVAEDGKPEGQHLHLDSPLKAHSLPQAQCEELLPVEGRSSSDYEKRRVMNALD